MKKIILFFEVILFCFLLSGWSSAEILQYGMSGEAVSALQNDLVDAGYLARTVDGEYGSTTVKAVSEFQKDKGLRITGKVDEETKRELRDAVGKGYRIGGGIIYAKGNRGAVIGSLQKKLNKLGYLSGSIDGVYGTDTVQAVKKLQKKYNIPLSGAVDEATWKVLSNTEEKKKVGTAPIYAKGDRGKNIEWLQKKLKMIEYLDGEIDGIYGEDTARAVKSFQVDEGLSDTGAVDKETLDRLNEKYETVSKNRIVKPGERGKRVIRLQNRLFLHGYHPGSSDGIYGAGTESAIKRLQIKENLKQTGIADFEVLDYLENPPFFTGKYKKVFHMRATAYTPYDGGNVGRTALGNYAGKGHAAVDPEMIPLGSIVYIEGYGYAICDDIGGAIKGNIIDVGVDTMAEAYEWGTRDNVKVYLVS